MSVNTGQTDKEEGEYISFLDPPWWVYYMTSDDQSIKRKKTIVGASQQPELEMLVCTLALGNSGGEHPPARGSRVAVWRPAILLGPFPLREKCDAVVTELSRGACNFDRKCDIACMLAAVHGVRCFTSRPRLSSKRERRMFHRMEDRALGFKLASVHKALSKRKHHSERRVTLLSTPMHRERDRMPTANEIDLC
jgi:hypothetical protein